MILIEALIGLVLAFAADLLTSLLLVVVFNVIGIGFLDALSYWQVFGLLVVVNILFAHTKILESFE